MTENEGFDQETFWQEFLARPCTLPNFEATLRGFESEAQARQVLSEVQNLLSLFGRIWNLERLHALTLAADYNVALAEIDQGTGTGRVVTATQDDVATGIAMTVPILIDGTPRIHLVINAALMLALLGDRETLEFHIARYTLAHECCHIHDLAVHDKVFPRVKLHARISGPRIYLNRIASACWSEYVACRLSAEFGGIQETEILERTFCTSLTQLRENGNDAIRTSRVEQDYGKLLDRIVTLYGGTMRYAAYLLGHLAGLQQSVADNAPKAREALSLNSYFEPVFWRLESTLEEMWNKYGEWPGSYDDLLHPLELLADEMLCIAGIKLQDTPTGIYVGVPFNPEVDIPWINP